MYSMNVFLYAGSLAGDAHNDPSRSLWDDTQ